MERSARTNFGDKTFTPPQPNFVRSALARNSKIWTDIRMILDALLGITFLGSIFALWYKLSQKLPELIAIPDEVITSRLEEDSAKYRLFVLSIKRYWKEKKYREWFWQYLSKGFHRLHILLLRLDNRIVTFLKTAKTRAGTANGNGNGDYWRRLQPENIAPKTSKDNRIQEVRIKKF